MDEYSPNPNGEISNASVFTSSVLRLRNRVVMVDYAMHRIRPGNNCCGGSNTVVDMNH